MATKNAKYATKTLPEIVLTALSKGMSAKYACAFAGISLPTFYRWCKDDSQYEIAVEQAKANGYNKVLDHLWNCIEKDDMRAIQLYLSRRTDDFKEEKVEQNGNISEGTLREIMNVIAANNALLPIKQKEQENKNE